MKSEQKTTYIYGLHSVLEAVKAGKPIDKIFLIRGLTGQLYVELKKLIDSAKLSYTYVPPEKLNKLSRGGNHQGVVARVSPVMFGDFDEVLERSLSANTPAFFLLLDGVTDVRNFGAIIRTASCVGVHAIIIPESGSAPVNEVTVKTSAGAAFEVPIVKVNHLKDAVYALQSAGITVVAATEKAKTSIYETELEGPLAVIMGSEEKGIQSSLLKLTDERISLPVMGNISSLNVSVACGVILYEVLRRRNGESAWNKAD